MSMFGDISKQVLRDQLIKELKKRIARVKKRNHRLLPTYYSGKQAGLQEALDLVQSISDWE